MSKSLSISEVVILISAIVVISAIVAGIIVRLLVSARHFNLCLSINLPSRGVHLNLYLSNYSTNRST